MIRMLRIISERTLDTDEHLCVCFTHWQKTFDGVNCTKLMHILKDWRETRFNSKLYMDLSDKIRLDQRKKISMKIGRGVRQGTAF